MSRVSIGRRQRLAVIYQRPRAVDDVAALALAQACAFGDVCHDAADEHR
jgi:hypothetical protein